MQGDSSPTKHAAIYTQDQAENNSELVSVKKEAPPPSFGEQTEIIVDWWSQIVNMYILELDGENENKILDVPMETVYEFLIKKRLVQDR